MPVYNDDNGQHKAHYTLHQLVEAKFNVPRLDCLLLKADIFGLLHLYNLALSLDIIRVSAQLRQVRVFFHSC